MKSAQIKNIIAILAMFAMVVLTAGTANAATITSNAVTNNWSAAATWVGGTPPGASDDAVIASGANITVTATAACSSITFPAGNNTTININSGISLTVSGAVSLPRPSNNRTNLINVGGGTFLAGLRYDRWYMNR